MCASSAILRSTAHKISSSRTAGGQPLMTKLRAPFAEKSTPMDFALKYYAMPAEVTSVTSLKENT